MDEQTYKGLPRGEQKKVPYKDLPQGRKIGGWAIIVILAIMFFGMVRTCSDEPAKKTDSADIANRAKEVSKNAVKPLLKAPSTASFTDEGQNVYLESDSTVTVKGYVDAQNSFGAMIRTGYYVRLKWVGDISQESNWLILEARLTE